ncbi:glycoside hydrolase family 3 protein [bacterium]|nr:glycoside hydrolase family 3 protein [bacterium]MBP9808420.1 glycoside hydrolase family 3 protein [bacterium]
MAGRLVIGRLPGLVLDNEHKQALKNGILGGITLFKENASDLKQLCTLTKDIVDACLHVPVLTVDQEGGAVQRFDHVLSPLPSPMALAAINDIASTSKITEISCRQLKTLGFNLLLAPTLDLLTNPLNPVIATRAFSSEIGLCTSMGRQVIEQIESSGLVACPKHFPGHGSTSQDSHLELAIVDKSLAELEAYDLEPFAANIKGMRSILVGHIWLPQLEKQRPATLSPLVVSEILRQKLGFDGLAVSDDMTMHAITKAYGLGEACVMAIEAGVDLILVCGTYVQSQEAVQAIAQAIASGRISKERLEECLTRLDKLFSQRPSCLDPTNEEALSAFAHSIEDDTITSTKFSTSSAALLKGNIDKLSLEGQQLAVVVPHHLRYSLPLAANLELENLDVQEHRYSLNPNHEEIVSLSDNLKASKRKIVYVTFRAFINSGQIELGEQLAQIHAHDNDNLGLLHIAADTPYDLLKLPKLLATSLATLDPSDQAMSGVAQIIAGKTRAKGKCPVNLSL